MSGAHGSRERELSTHERVAAAGGAAVLSSILVNPLDVVKTRMQAQATSRARPPADAFSPASLETRRWALTNANGLHGWPLRNTQEPPLLIHRPPPHSYRGTFDGLVRIARSEGLPVLYRGMDLNLLVSVPLVCLYLPAYDALSASFSQAGAGHASPLLAGAAARAGAVLLCSPLELCKTRLQAATDPGGSGASLAGVWRSLGLSQQPGLLARVRTLWTGVGATLLKDVPFAALFWSLHEPLKQRLAQAAGDGQDSQVLLTNVVAGGAAGGAAAALTTPLDAAKTQLQTQRQLGAAPPSLRAALGSIAAIGGWRGLFAGCAPRALRTAVAYSILMGSYEQWKRAVAASSAAPAEQAFACGVPALASPLKDAPEPAKAC